MNGGDKGATRGEGYAAAGIPVYLLIDREGRALTVHSQPEDGKYRSPTTRPFGAVAEIPDPVDITLETEKLKDFAQWRVAGGIL